MSFILAVLWKHWVYSGFVEIADVFKNVDLRTEPHFFEIYYSGKHGAKQICEFRYVVIVSPVAYVDDYLAYKQHVVFFVAMAA